mmetsp:Transcript_6141/g.14151  ORF Transcript_6141/g.14151 Transcript_6141/m.14151 type:complete len:209 (+) Transcript_6141:678-1304(+)
MEECLNFPESHERGFVAHRGGAVASQVCHGNVDIECLALATAVCHPGTAALVCRSGIGVEVERGDVLVALLVKELEELDVFVPHLSFSGCLSYLDAEDAVDQSKHSFQHFVQGKIRSELFLLEFERLLLEPLVPEVDVPGHELGQIGLAIFFPTGLTRQSSRSGQFLLSSWQCLLQYKVREILHALDGRSHLALQGKLGVVVIAEDAR